MRSFDASKVVLAIISNHLFSPGRDGCTALFSLLGPVLVGKPQPWGTIIFASVLAAYVSMLFWLAGYKLTKASIASVLDESAAAFIVLFAYLILKEPLQARKLWGLCLTLAAVVSVLTA